MFLFALLSCYCNSSGTKFCCTQQKIMISIQKKYLYNIEAKNYLLIMGKDPLGTDATNPVPNTDWSSGVCWRVPVKC